jgi:hypothetical protein
MKEISVGFRDAATTGAFDECLGMNIYMNVYICTYIYQMYMNVYLYVYKNINV